MWASRPFPENVWVRVRTKVFIRRATASIIVELLEGEKLRRRMLASYSRDPRGWSFVISPSLNSGFFDATVSGPNETWMLKIDSLFKPSPIVIGSQAESPQRRRDMPFPYGFRPLPPDLVIGLMSDSESDPEDALRKRLLSVLGSDPVVPEQGQSYAQGPLILTGPEKASLSDTQRVVDSKLASEMRRLLRLRYPAYG